MMNCSIKDKYSITTPLCNNAAQYHWNIILIGSGQIVGCISWKWYTHMWNSTASGLETDATIRESLWLWYFGDKEMYLSILKLRWNCKQKFDNVVEVFWINVELHQQINLRHIITFLLLITSFTCIKINKKQLKYICSV